MNRQEFLFFFLMLLGDLSEEEREAVVQYYEDYFADAGPEMEDQIIQELGSPEKVALMIREGLRGENAGDEYAETGFSQTRYDDRKMPVDYTKPGEEASDRKPWTSRTLKIILIILIICVGCSAVIPAVSGIICGILGIIAGMFGIFFAFVIVSFCVAIAGGGLVIAGITTMFSAFPAGLLICGIGLLILAAGILLVAASIRLCSIMVPVVFRFLVSIGRRIFYGRRGHA